MAISQQLFILGAPRSGTTFLSGLLKSTRFNSPVETHFITKYYKKLSKYGDLNNRESFNSLVEDILSERPVQQWRLDFNADDLYDKLKPHISYANIVSAIILHREQLQGRGYWGDKTPHYLGDLDILVELFPQAKFIYIVRDGRDVALSLLRKPWGPNNIYECALYWSMLNNQDRLIEDLQKKNRLHRVTYEELLDNTKPKILEIFEFLDEAIDEEEVSILAKTTQTKNYNKWKDHMTAQQVRIFEAVASKELRKFNYELVNEAPAISFPEKCYFKLHGKVRRVWFLFHANVVDGFKIRYLGKQPFNE